eukprot:scaffold680_cov264-Pinguiococcus_pyrenoidosus.AAC.14
MERSFRYEKHVTRLQHCRRELRPLRMTVLVIFDRSEASCGPPGWAVQGARTSRLAAPRRGCERDLCASASASCNRRSRSSPGRHPCHSAPIPGGARWRRRPRTVANPAARGTHAALRRSTELLLDSPPEDCGTSGLRPEALLAARSLPTCRARCTPPALAPLRRARPARSGPAAAVREARKRPAGAR